MQVSKQLGNLSQYSDIAFTSRNGIHAVMELLQGLHGSHDAALHALQECRAQCWALGADAEALRSLGVQNVQTPPEVCTPPPPLSLPPLPALPGWLRMEEPLTCSVAMRCPATEKHHNTMIEFPASYHMYMVEWIVVQHFQ